MISRLAPVFVAVVLLAVACGSDSTTTTDNTTTIPESAAETSAAPTTSAASDISGDKPEVVVPADAPTELVIDDLEVGSGDGAKSGDYLIMHYVGVRHSDGGQFDASWDRGDTFAFTLGSGQVIQGWDEGLVGMQEGGRRLLSIPSAMAYGSQARGADIPADSDLVFVVDLVDLVSQPLVENAPAPVTELEVTVLEEGSGVEVEVGALIEIHYVAVNQVNGQLFDSSFLNGQPARFIVGAEPSQAIPAWDEGLIGKNVGDHVRLVIPPEMGITGADDVIGPDDTIITEVKILSAQS